MPSSGDGDHVSTSTKRSNGDKSNGNYHHLRGESLRSAAALSVGSRSVRSHGTDGKKDNIISGGRGVRVMPTWAAQREVEDEDDGLISPLPTAYRRPPTHSAHDPRRETTPVTMMSPARDSLSGSRWRGFVEASSLPPGTAHSEKLDDNWLDQQADLNRPWLASTRDVENGQGGERSSDDHDLPFLKQDKRRKWYQKIQIMLLNNPMVPLTFRAFIWVMSLLALAFAGTVYRESQKHDVEQKPSTIMAIVVDVIALVYLIYITYDEYSGKPLGLRSPTAKMRLVMLDLLFIVFGSANLSLAFDTLFDTRWSCTADPGGPEGTRLIEPMCERQRVLAAFLFLALCGWVSTFTVSLFRLVERVART